MNTTALIILLSLNLLGLFMMLWDKYRAKSGGWRVPEKRLFWIALVGGSIGIFMGMRMVRHKTKHQSFVYGIPFCIILNCIFVYPLVYYNPLEWYSILLRFL